MVSNPNRKKISQQDGRSGALIGGCDYVIQVETGNHAKSTRHQGGKNSLKSWIPASKSPLGPVKRYGTDG
uniref:Uncharacterized protein n=1 Tax=Arundo donax TaxID=35708 RepID=A0A0A9B1D2_ARUDO